RQAAARGRRRAIGVVEEIFAGWAQRQQPDLAAHRRPRRRCDLLRLPRASRAPRPLKPAVIVLLALSCTAHAQDRLEIGSKRFTESYILGEILARAAGGEHKPGLGNTGIVAAALKAGAIDVYPEY